MTNLERMSEHITFDSGKGSYCAPCIICGELVKLRLNEERMLGYGKTPSPKVCDKCREAVLTLREIFEGVEE